MDYDIVVWQEGTDNLVNLADAPVKQGIIASCYAKKLKETFAKRIYVRNNPNCGRFLRYRKF